MREMFICALLLVLPLCFVMTAHPDGGSSPAQKGEEDEIVEIIQGFEDEAPAEGSLENLIEGFENEFFQGYGEKVGEEERKKSPREKSVSFRLDGKLAFTATYNLSSGAKSPWRGFTMARPELTLALNNRFSDKWKSKMSVRGFYDTLYSLRGRDEYTDEVLREYEKELELKDAYVQGQLTDRLDVKIGRQVVVWGALDNLRAVDVLNPFDLRVPGLTDIDDLRLPVTMVKLDYYVGAWNLSCMVVPEVRFSKLPAFGSDYFPFPAPFPSEGDPDEGFDHVQYAASLTGVFSGWDLGVYWADIYDDQIYLAADDDQLHGQFASKRARVTMLGAAGNLAFGDWLFKAEAAWIDGLQYSNTPDVQYHRLDLGAGVEYSGFKDAFISLEAVNRHIYDYDLRLKLSPDQVDQDEFQWAFRFTKDFIHDTLTLTCLISTYGVKIDDGLYGRIEAQYKITDAVGVRAGIVFYQAGDKKWFQDVDKNDRVFAVLTYSF